MKLGRMMLFVVMVAGIMAMAGCNRAATSASEGVPVQATTTESLQQNRQRGADTARQLGNMGKR